MTDASGAGRTRTLGAVPRPSRSRATLSALLAPLILVAALAGCSSSREIPPYADEGFHRTTTTADPLEGAELASGAAGVEELQRLFDRLLASNDACAILTQRDVEENRLDPTIFTNAESRRLLAEGLVKVFDHLITLSPPTITAALQAEKNVFSQILDVVDRYASNPNSPGATGEIEVLVNSQDFLAAGQQISNFVASGCR
jgi:hypothetical protein